MGVDPSQLRIVLYPHPALRRVARPIEQVTDDVRKVALRMQQLMHDARGVGLAAPQVGLSWRLFVTAPPDAPDQGMVLINPVLSDPSRDLAEYEEGCLSLPEITGQIQRPRSITIDALGLDGSKIHLSSDEMPSRIWQHEVDHLDGTLIIDRMTPIDKLANRRSLRELEGKERRA